MQCLLEIKNSNACLNRTGVVFLKKRRYEMIGQLIGMVLFIITIPQIIVFKLLKLI